ncbi:MAG: hypothetical protein WBC51_04940 [Vicinamibacterales bacterium]
MTAGRFFRSHTKPRPPRPSAALARYIDVTKRQPQLAALIASAIKTREELLRTAWLGNGTEPDPGLRSQVRALFPPRTYQRADGWIVTAYNSDASAAEKFVLDALRARGIFAPAVHKRPRVHVSAEHVRERRARKNAMLRDRARLRRRRQPLNGEKSNVTG